MSPRRLRPSCRRGYTLIEAISTIVILGALGSVASSIVLTATNGYLDASTSAQLHTEASMAMDRIARELRNIELDSSASGVACDINSVKPTSINWGTGNAVVLNGTDLELQIDSVTRILLNDVSAFSVQAYDESNNAMAGMLNAAQCDPIRRIQITITLERNGVSETLRSRVFLRATMQGASP